MGLSLLLRGWRGQGIPSARFPMPRTRSPSLGTRRATPVPPPLPPVHTPHCAFPHHLASTRREGWNPPTPPIPPPSHVCLPHLCMRTVRKGAGCKGKGQGRAVVQLAQQAVGGNTVTDMSAVQRATQAGAVHVNGRVGVRRRVRREAESHDGTPACAQRVRVCERDQTRPRQGGCRERKGRALIPYSCPVD